MAVPHRRGAAHQRRRILICRSIFPPRAADTIGLITPRQKHQLSPSLLIACLKFIAVGPRIHLSSYSRRMHPPLVPALITTSHDTLDSLYFPRLGLSLDCCVERKFTVSFMNRVRRSFCTHLCGLALSFNTFANATTARRWRDAGQY